MDDARQALKSLLEGYRLLFGPRLYRPVSAAKPVKPMPQQPDLFGAEASAPERDPYRCVEALIPEDSPLRKMKTLEEVEAYVRNTVLVPIDATRTNPVFGDGPPHADLMVIGEAPGAEEDRQGKPFVGRAGQLLNKMLEAIGFRREEVYIANVLKSRPPNNRDPLPEEVAAHLPILYKQIALVRPRIILCVGRFAAQAILRRQAPLKALRGKVHDFCGIPVVVTYHPAALLRNPQLKYAAWEDLKLLRKTYDELVGQHDETGR